MARRTISDYPRARAARAAGGLLILEDADGHGVSVPLAELAQALLSGVPVSSEAAAPAGSWYRPDATSAPVFKPAP